MTVLTCGAFFPTVSKVQRMRRLIPVSILYKSIAVRYRPVSVADGQITARYRFIKNASWDMDIRCYHMA